jgi:hypothetical protein
VSKTWFCCRHLIPKQPTVNIQDFEESITVFVAPELKATAGFAPLLLCPAHCESVLAQCLEPDIASTIHRGAWCVE